MVEKDPTSRILAIRITVTNHTDRAEFAALATDALAGEHTGAIPWPEDADVDACASTTWTTPARSRRVSTSTRTRPTPTPCCSGSVPDTDLDELSLVDLRL